MARVKKRYLCVRVVGASKHLLCSKRIDAKEGPITQSVREAIKECWGDYGEIINSTVTEKYYNEDTGLAIIRVGSRFEHDVWASITTITSIDGKTMSLQVVHVGGSVKACHSAVLEINRDAVRRTGGQVDRGALLSS
eukprot:gb/GECH01014853.1/.p1 GENE.gb/GECH01014853.1/~~gb/GECH01014853.1/.p1  ORF type:complete len:137 (+),score=17.73 gb/GECH01014853.1/:1-411(+)